MTAPRPPQNSEMVTVQVNARRHNGSQYLPPQPAAAADKGVEVAVVTIADEICPKSLQKALSNLLENAIKCSVVVGKSAKKSHSASHRNPRPRVRVSVVPNSNPFAKGIKYIWNRTLCFNEDLKCVRDLSSRFLLHCPWLNVRSAWTYKHCRLDLPTSNSGV